MVTITGSRSFSVATTLFALFKQRSGFAFDSWEVTSKL